MNAYTPKRYERGQWITGTARRTPGAITAADALLLAGIAIVFAAMFALAVLS